MASVRKVETMKISEEEKDYELFVWAKKNTKIPGFYFGDGSNTRSARAPLLSDNGARHYAGKWKGNGTPRQQCQQRKLLTVFWHAREYY